MSTLDLDLLERLAKQALDPAEFSLFRQKAAHELRTACTVEVIAALVAEVRRLQAEVVALQRAGNQILDGWIRDSGPDPAVIASERERCAALVRRLRDSRWEVLWTPALPTVKSGVEWEIGRLEALEMAIRDPPQEGEPG